MESCRRRVRSGRVLPRRHRRRNVLDLGAGAVIKAYMSLFRCIALPTLNSAPGSHWEITVGFGIDAHQLFPFSHDAELAKEEITDAKLLDLIVLMTD